MGQIIRFVTKKKYLKYPEEQEDFVCPASYEKRDSIATLVPVPSASDHHAHLDPALQAAHKDKELELEQAPTVHSPGVDTEQGGKDLDLEKTGTPRSPVNAHRPALGLQKTRTNQSSWSAPRRDSWVAQPSALEKAESRPIIPQKTADGTILVDWYTTDDPENPQNWSGRRKRFVTFVICCYTFAVYIGSAIYTPSIPGVMQVFNVSLTRASLGLSLYVLGYGVAPMIWSPISELPIAGRNAPYLATFGIFVILIVPTALVDNFAGLLVLRFLLGFFGSPALATGGASMQDMYDFLQLPYLLAIWVAFATCGPALGPLVGGFSVAAENWRWTSWELLWLSGPVFVMMFFFLPETAGPTLLLRRAQRLRARSGNPMLKSQSEIDQKNLTFKDIAVETLYRPILITILDPAVLFANVYTSIVYGIYYSFFEAFPLVYPRYYGFNAGETGLTFLSITVSVVLGCSIYWANWGLRVVPRIKKNGPGAPESLLVPALIASFTLPIGLFLFGWTARPAVHWIASIIGITIYSTGVFIIIQCIFLYLPLSYPQYAASLFATNDLWRSALACGAILFAHPLYVNLGIGPGISLLAGLTILCIGGIFMLYYFGATLRARSKFAVKDATE